MEFPLHVRLLVNVQPTTILNMEYAISVLLVAVVVPVKLFVLLVIQVWYLIQSQLYRQ